MKKHSELIKEFKKTKIALEEVLLMFPLSIRVTRNDWVIEKRTNKHFQFDNIKENVINLIRTNDNRNLLVDIFDENFTLATPEQVENHLRFLNKKELFYGKEVPVQKFDKTSRNEIQLPEFYMITVEGKYGTVVRHADFQTAVAEATRLAKKSNHRAHIMGVVGIVEPVQVQQPVTEYKLIKN